MEMVEIKNKSSEIARSMRAIYYENCEGIKQPIAINTQKLANSIGENLGYTITSHTTTALGEHVLAMIYRIENKNEAVVLVADSSNECWKRFTYIKEVCQLFIDDKRDNPAEATEIVETLLNQDIDGKYYQSEVLAAFTAINIMIPDYLETWMKHQVNVERKTSFQVAAQLKAPRKYVEFRMREWEINISD